MISFDKLIFAAVALGCGAYAVREDADILRTAGPLSASVTVPQNESTSTLMFWAESPNTTVRLHIFAHYTYKVEFTINQTHIWHIAYLYQPASSEKNRSRLSVPSCVRFWTFANNEINNMTLFSDNEVRWMFCGNIYICKLQPPFATSSRVRSKEYSEGSANYAFGLLMGISALCVILIIVIVTLAVFLFRVKKVEHHYEKAFWPPIAPPPIPESLHSSLNRGLDANVTKSCERDSLEQLPKAVSVMQESWNAVTEDPRASILDYQSVNSIYGMAIS